MMMINSGKSKWWKMLRVVTTVDADQFRKDAAGRLSKMVEHRKGRRRGAVALVLLSIQVKGMAARRSSPKDLSHLASPNRKSNLVEERRLGAAVCCVGPIALLIACCRLQLYIEGMLGCSCLSLRMCTRTLPACSSGPLWPTCSASATRTHSDARRREEVNASASSTPYVREGLLNYSPPFRASVKLLLSLLHLASCWEGAPGTCTHSLHLVDRWGDGKVWTRREYGSLRWWWPLWACLRGTFLDCTTNRHWQTMNTQTPCLPFFYFPLHSSTLTLCSSKEKFSIERLLNWYFLDSLFTSVFGQENWSFLLCTA